MGSFAENRHVLTNEERNKSGKGYTQHFYTVKTIAHTTDRAEGTVRNDMACGKVDVDSLKSVAEYIFKCRKR